MKALQRSYFDFPKKRGHPGIYCEHGYFSVYKFSCIYENGQFRVD